MKICRGPKIWHLRNAFAIGTILACILPISQLIVANSLTDHLMSVFTPLALFSSFIALGCLICFLTCLVFTPGGTAEVEIEEPDQKDDEFEKEEQLWIKQRVEEIRLRLIDQK